MQSDEADFNEDDENEKIQRQMGDLLRGNRQRPTSFAGAGVRLFSLSFTLPTGKIATSENARPTPMPSTASKNAQVEHRTRQLQNHAEKGDPFSSC
ncbi:MAG: hypothetical protein ACLRSW_17680 [Christensenellaceae bacterium]